MGGLRRWSVMRLRLFLVRILWKGIRWRKHLIYRLLARRQKQIKPLSTKNLDGLRADFVIVDECETWGRKE